MRKLIHSSPLFDQRWFNFDGSVKSEQVFKLVQDSIVDRYMLAGELGDHFLNVIFGWAGWHDQFKDQIIDNLSSQISLPPTVTRT